MLSLGVEALVVSGPHGEAIASLRWPRFALTRDARPPEH
jgi:hypothetical protein